MRRDPADDLGDLPARFRDDEQCRRVQELIGSRLADDRLQDECRYLMRLIWQLRMSYTEVRHDELREHVGPATLAVVDELIAAIRASPEAIDQWCTAVLERPVVEDRTWSRGPGRDEADASSRTDPSARAS